MNTRILSGITPSGDGTLHIGNYFGAVKQHIDSQNDDAERLFFIADYHALNLIKDPKQLESNIKNLALNYIALGIDPEKTHKIERLIETCLKIDPSFIDLKDAVLLTEYAVEFRYPASRQRDKL